MTTTVDSECTSLITACDNALDDKVKQVEIRDLRIQGQESVIQQQQETISSDKGIWKSPWLWLAVGLVAGKFVVGGK